MSVAIGSIAAGQTVTGETITGGTLDGSRKGITLKGCTFVGQHIIKAKPDMNLLIQDGKKINDNAVTPNTYEGQFEIDGNGVNWGSGRAGIIFRNFTSQGGTGDGIQIGATRGVRIEGGEFFDHAQNSSIHADAVQVMASQFIVFSGVWFHNNASCIMMVDWDNSDNEVSDCLFTNGDGWECCMSGVPRVKFEHNTIYKPNYGVRIQDDHDGNPTSNGYSVRYNAYPSGFSPNLNSGSGTSSPNLTGAVYTFPADPGTRAGFQLKTPTMAPDGTVWGSRALGLAPPPPPPPPAPGIAVGDHVKITNPRSTYYGQTGIVNSVNADKKTAMVAISHQFPLSSLTEV